MCQVTLVLLQRKQPRALTRAGDRQPPSLRERERWANMPASRPARGLSYGTWRALCMKLAPFRMTRCRPWARLSLTPSAYRSTPVVNLVFQIEKADAYTASALFFNRDFCEVRKSFSFYFFGGRSMSIDPVSPTFTNRPSAARHFAGREVK